MPTRFERLFALLGEGETEERRVAAAKVLGELAADAFNASVRREAEVSTYLKCVHSILRRPARSARLAAARSLGFASRSGLKVSTTTWDYGAAAAAASEGDERIKLDHLRDLTIETLIAKDFQDQKRAILDLIVRRRRGKREGAREEEDAAAANDVDETDPTDEVFRKRRRPQNRQEERMADATMRENMDDLIVAKDVRTSSDAVPKAETKPARRERARDVVQRSVRRVNQDRRRRRRDVVVESKVTNVGESSGREGPAVAAAAFAQSSRWSLRDLCSRLNDDLLDQSWLARHGAAIGLADMIRESTVKAESAFLQEWLEDCACRCVCVIALDHYKDFYTGTARAPCADASGLLLSVVCERLEPERTLLALDLLLDLQTCDMWQVRHSSMLAIKHLVPVVERQRRVTTTTTTTTTRFETIATRLIVAGQRAMRDAVEDVRVAAASALLRLLSLLRVVAAENTSAKTADEDGGTTTCLEPFRRSANDLLPLLWSQLEAYARRLRDGDEICTSDASLKPMIELTAELCNVCPTIRVLATIPSSETASTLRTHEVLDVLLCHSFKFVRSAALSLVDAVVAETCRRSWDAVERLAWRLLAVRVFDPSDRVASKATGVSKRVLGALLSKAAAGGEGASPRRLRRLLEDFLRHVTNRWPTLDDPADAFVSVPNSIVLYKNVDDEASRTKIELRSPCREILADRAGERRARVATIVADVLEMSPSSSFDVLVEELRSTSALRNVTACLAMTTLVDRAEGDENESTQRMIRCGFNRTRRADVRAALLRALQEACGANRTRPHDECSTAHRRLHDACAKLGYEEEKEDASVGDNPQQPRLISTSRVREHASVRETGKAVLDEAAALESEYVTLDTARLSAAAAALVRLRDVEKVEDAVDAPRASISSLILPALFRSIRAETRESLQKSSAGALVRVLERLVGRGTSCAKILRNVLVFFCPKLSREKEGGRVAEKEEDAFDALARARREDRNLPCWTGAEAVLSAATRTFGDRLFESLPTIADALDALEANDAVRRVRAHRAVASLFRVAIVCDAHVVSKRVVSLLPRIATAACVGAHDLERSSAYLTLRIGASAAAVDDSDLKRRSNDDGAMTTSSRRVVQSAVLEVVETRLLRRVTDGSNTLVRIRAALIASSLLKVLSLDLVLSRIASMIRTVLEGCNDVDDRVREVSSGCLARLLDLLPLGSTKATKTATTSWRRSIFLRRLLGDGGERAGAKEDRPSDNDLWADQFPSNAEPRTVRLRAYQRRGVAWMWFLRRAGLHPLLADDMGLGKTLMALCVLVADARERRTSPSSFSSSSSEPSMPLPSLVVCPATLVRHWSLEARRFFPDFFKGSNGPIELVGRPSVRRKRLRESVVNVEYPPALVVTSYAMLRSDEDILRSLKWSYVVLDEGHRIRNPKTAVSRAAFGLRATYKMVLSGTPLQNATSELWSIFRFLAPGYFGTRRAFRAQFEAPVEDARTRPNDAEVVARSEDALAALHRRLVPFVLRRLKSDVLAELPPRTIVDVHVPMTPTQRRLHGALCGALRREKRSEVVSDGKRRGVPFARYDLLLKLCTHPALLVGEEEEEEEEKRSVTERYGLTVPSTALSDYRSSCKFVAFADLLVSCGLCAKDEEEEEEEEEGASQSSASRILSSSSTTTSRIGTNHRALVFAQKRRTLDLLVSQVLRKKFPSTPFLRIDGSTPLARRASVVSRFEEDPTIALLLMTTKVGGVGLNLTAADTVIFLEHDWNPQVDLQAMDRAHRLGQRRDVNVYRIITDETVEAELLGMQRFKLAMTSSVVIESDATMGDLGVVPMDDLLDRFGANGAARENDDEEEVDRGETDSEEEANADMDEDVSRSAKRRRRNSSATVTIDLSNMEDKDPELAGLIEAGAIGFGSEEEEEEEELSS